jgi:type VI secretion system protein ImpJ
MSWNSKVIWSEGMLLQPQHLQQHDRYLHTLVETRVKHLRPYAWGFSELQIDSQQLALGKFCLQACRAILPDGTPIDLPGNDELPVPLDIPETARDVLVVLALPAQRVGIREVDSAAGQDGFARFTSEEFEVQDNNRPENRALMQVGKLRLQLALEKEAANVYTTLSVARIIERRADQRVVLDPDFCPPCLDYRVAPRLGRFVDELVGLLHQRGEALASRPSHLSSTGTAEIADFLLLQSMNRAEPLYTHLATMTGLHPEALYQKLLELAGELSTFARPSKRPNQAPVYRHDHLQETFTPVIEDLRQSLSIVTELHVVPITIEKRDFGMYVALFPDVTLLKSAAFVLAVSAQSPTESMRSKFPQQVKIGSIEKIRDLVNLQLTGVSLNALPVAPRQLPFHAGYTYFELDRESEQWGQISVSAGLAIHVAGEFPGLKMELWAIKN